MRSSRFSPSFKLFLMFVISSILPPILYPPILPHSSSHASIPTMTGHVPKSPTSKTIPPPVYFHCKRIPSRRNPCTLPLSSYNHCICSFYPFHQSRPCCRLLRQWLPSLPHQWSWQALSLLLLNSSSFFPSSQPFFLFPTLPPVSVKGCCPPILLLDGGRRIFCLHQLPPNPSIHPSLELLY